MNRILNDLLKGNEELKQKQYDKKVEALIRKKYSQGEVEAIMNNYIAEPNNEEYKKEFFAFQAYRKECKIKAGI